MKTKNSGENRNNCQSISWNCFGVVLLAVLVTFITNSEAFAAPENLDEAVARKSRMSTAIYSNLLLENSSSFFRWQPETLNYTDVTSNNEVWQLTNSPANINRTQDISISHWSANGKRFLFHSRRPTAAFSTWGDSLWMLSNTDGSLMRPAKNAAAQLATMDAYPLWSPVLADVLYQGASNDGQGLAANGFYKVQVSDTTISRSQFLTIPGSLRIALKKAISGDGRKVMITDVTNGKFQPATVYPEASKALDTTSGYSNQLAFDYYWGKAPSSWASYHDNFLSGAVGGADGVWNYIMPENASGSWWRARLTGSGVNQSPVIVQDHTPPYVWGGQLEPINSPFDGVNPWCPQGLVPGTDCMEYFSHFTPDRWGRYGISTKSSSYPYGTSIADLRNHSYKVAGFTPISIGGVPAQWVQHHDWEAWSDWSASSAYTLTSDYVTGAVVTQNHTNVSSQKMLANPHTRYNAGGASNGVYEALARPTQSPDGTKVMFNSTFLNSSDNFPQIFWTVAYYPYPPEIKSAVKNGGSVRLSWDFNQGASGSPNLVNPRTYATRGWPHDTADRPPSPRETAQFRVWSSDDAITWLPLGTTAYNNCTGSNECGTWTETAWSFDAAQANNSTKYYAVTSLEHSGLESRALSNLWKVVLDASGSVLQQVQHSGYPTNPGGKSNFYTVQPPGPLQVNSVHMQAPASNAGQYTITWSAPANKTMIRFYNVYAADGSVPTAIQQRRIASVPASSDYDGTGSYKYFDWLGNVSGATKYLVTSVDFQGNESPAVGKPSNPVGIRGAITAK